MTNLPWMPWFSIYATVWRDFWHFTRIWNYIEYYRVTWLCPEKKSYCSVHSLDWTADDWNRRQIRVHTESYYAALLPRRGPHIASHSVCPSVCPSVRPSRYRCQHSITKGNYTVLLVSVVLVFFLVCLIYSHSACLSLYMMRSVIVINNKRI